MVLYIIYYSNLKIHKNINPEIRGLKYGVSVRLKYIIEYNNKKQKVK